MKRFLLSLFLFLQVFNGVHVLGLKCVFDNRRIRRASHRNSIQNGDNRGDMVYGGIRPQVSNYSIWQPSFCVSTPNLIGMLK